MITEYSQINSDAPDRLAIPGLDYSMFSKAVNYVERKPVGGPSDGAVPPFYPLVTEFDELLEPETEEDEPIEQYSVMLKEGYVIERSPTGDAIIIHIPAVDLDPMDSDPRPTVSVPVGKAVFVRIQTDDSGEINESVAIVVDDPDKESVHHSVGVDGDYYIKVGEMKLGEDEGEGEVPYYKTYVQSDIDHYREDGFGSPVYNLSNYDEQTADVEGTGRVLYSENPNDPDDGGKSWVLRIIEGEERVTVESEGGVILLESADFGLTNYSGGTETDGQILESETVNADGGKSWVLRELVAGDNITITNDGGTIEIASTGGSGSGVQTEQAETQVQAATDSINILGTGNTRADDVLEFTAGAGSQTDLGIKSAGSGDVGKVVTHDGTNWTRDYVRLVDL